MSPWAWFSFERLKTLAFTRPHIFKKRHGGRVHISLKNQFLLVELLQLRHFIDSPLSLSTSSRAIRDSNIVR